MFRLSRTVNLGIQQSLLSLYHHSMRFFSLQCWNLLCPRSIYEHFKYTVRPVEKEGIMQTPHLKRLLYASTPTHLDTALSSIDLSRAYMGIHRADVDPIQIMLINGSNTLCRLYSYYQFKKYCFAPFILCCDVLLQYGRIVCCRCLEPVTTSPDLAHHFGTPG